MKSANRALSPRIQRILWSIVCLLVLTSCSNPVPYLLDQPAFSQTLPDHLLEISGIAFISGDSLVAHDDESARLTKWKSHEIMPFQLTGSTQEGDFEDIAVMGDTVWLLESSGRLFQGSLKGSDSLGGFTWRDLQGLPPGAEWEGLAWDATTQRLCLLSKSPLPGAAGVFGVFACSPLAGPALPLAQLQASELLPFGIEEFRPSGLERHPHTGDWYVISADKPALAIYSSEWKLITAAKLSKDLLRKAEAITFLPDGTLVLASEGKKPKKKKSGQPALLHFFSPQ